MKKLTLLLLISMSLYSQSYNTDLLSITISTEKDTYLLDEPIDVEFKQTNIGNVDVLTKNFHFDYPEFYYATLIGSEGTKLERIGARRDVHYTEPSEGYLLKPGESQYHVIYLNGYYGYPDNRTEAWQSRYLSPGEYRFQITHYTNANFMHEYFMARYNVRPRTKEEMAEIWGTIDKMPITSNELIIHIVLPNEQQEKERLVYMECKGQAWRENKNKFIELYKNYFAQYHNSENYYKYSLMRMLYIFYPPPANTIIVYTPEELIEQTKDSYFAFYTASLGHYVYEDLKSDERQFTPWIERYNRLAKQYPNTQLSKYAKIEARDKKRYKARLLKAGKSE